MIAENAQDPYCAAVQNESLMGGSSLSTETNLTERVVISRMCLFILRTTTHSVKLVSVESHYECN